MKKKEYTLPSKVSDIDVVYDKKGHVESYTIELTFDNIRSVQLPHARGGRVQSVKTGLKTVVEYSFLESVAKSGMRNVCRFQSEMLNECLKQRHENLK